MAAAGDDILADMVALRHYLSEDGDGIDTSLREGATGSHVAVARCAASGLRRLPVYEGPTTFPASPVTDELRLLRTHQVLPEWGFLHALITPCAAVDDTYDVLVWSTTSRRTALLEPDAGQIDDRVVFLPGTRFKLLLVVEPSRRTRGQILLRELAAEETGADRQPGVERTSTDEVAVTSLRRQVELWAAARPLPRIGSSGSSRFGALPGLLTVR